MIIAVTGASGFVGRHFCAIARGKGHEVLTLSRGAGGDRTWDPMHEPAPLEGADAVVHLAGEPLTGGRWTRAKMQRIRASRAVGTRNLVAGIRKARPQVLVSASAVGYYGDRGEVELTEESSYGPGFLSKVCLDWEAEARASGIRTVILRTATVLGPGGALEKMIGPFSKGLGGRLGTGRQWMSWIHRHDLVELYLHALTRPELAGPLIAAAPDPVRNETFTRILGRILERPTLLRIPKWALRLRYGKIASVLLASQKCRPVRALESGFAFAYPGLEGALHDSVAALRRREAA